MYVDDIIVTGDMCSDLEDVIRCLDQTFSLKDLGELNYFLSLELNRKDGFLHVSQQKYARDLLQRAHMENAKPLHTPMVQSPTLTSLTGSPLVDGTEYQKVVGICSICF